MNVQDADPNNGLMMGSPMMNAFREGKHARKHTQLRTTLSAFATVVAAVLAAPAASLASDSQADSQLVPGYEYKIAFTGGGNLSSSDSSGDGWDDNQAADWNIVPSQPVELWLAKINPPAGASYTTTARSPDMAPAAGTMVENGHWPDTDGEHAYSCQGPVGVNAVALFMVRLGSAPTIRTDFAGVFGAGGGAEAAGTGSGSCTNTPEYSGIGGLAGFFAFWAPPGFIAPGTGASGETLAVGAPIPSQDIGRASFEILAQDYNQVTDPNVCPFSDGPPTCKLKFQLSGNYKFTEVCAGKVAVTPGGTPTGTCNAQRLKDAAKAAKEAKQEAKRQSYRYHADCGGWKGTATSVDEGGKYICAAEDLQWQAAEWEATHLRPIANDPPDSNFTSIARPRQPHVKELGKWLGKLRRVLPATYRLLRSDSQIAGLVGAVATSLNRVSGALLASSAGDTAAGRDLAKQQQAAHSYAKRAAHLLGGRRRLARKAAAELRRFASGVKGPGAARLRALERHFASGLVAKQAAGADRLAAAALNGIGT